MKHVSRIAGLVLLGVLCAATATIRAQQPPPTRGLRVLFIGNSFTYYNNLPEMFAGLAATAAAAYSVEVRMIAPGGVTLEQHWKNGEALSAIREGLWDWVVLQEQSQLGVKLVNRQSLINDPRNFHEFARLFDAEIRSFGAKPIFLHTWARRDAPEQQRALDYAYMSIARELNTPVIPVGLAWTSLRAERPDLSLYVPDGSHPSPAGSYLAACLIYSALFEESPEGLAAEIRGRPIRTSPGPPVGADTIEPLVSLSEPDAVQIQQIAWRTFTGLRSSGGYLDVKPHIDTVPLPTLPARRRVPQVKDLTGMWYGSLTLYSNPATMDLRLQWENGRWDANAIVEIETAQGPNRYVYPATDFSINGTEISFTIVNPTGTGINEKYRGVFTGDSLAGTAEFGSATDPPHLIGTWEVKRR